MANDDPALRSLGALGLRELWAHFDGGDEEPEPAALLAGLPLAEKVFLSYTTGSITDATFLNLPPRPALRWLKLTGIWHFRAQLTPAGLLGLGRTLPGLTTLQLGNSSWDEEREALYALGGGVDVGGGSDGEPGDVPLSADPEPGVDEADPLEAEMWSPLDKISPEAQELLRAIRGALRRLG